MTQTVAAQDVRNKFSEILNTAIYGSTDIIVTRFNKPQAVIVSYKEYKRLMNPQSHFTKAEWKRGFEIFDTIRAKNKNIPASEIEKGVRKAIKAVRRGKHV